MKQISEGDLAEILSDTGCYPTQESINKDIDQLEDCHCDRIPRLNRWLRRCGELIRMNRRKYQEQQLRADDLQGKVQDLEEYINTTSEIFKTFLPVCPLKTKQLLFSASEKIKHHKGLLQTENAELRRALESIYQLATQALAEPNGTKELVQICSLIEDLNGKDGE